jgi:DNA-binding SARP family transcriptional activator
MSFDYRRPFRFMLDGARGANRSPEGGGRNRLIARFAATGAQLPKLAQRLWPTDLSSALLLLAFGWTTLVGVSLSLVCIVTLQTNWVLVPLVAPFAVVGLLGLWRRIALWMLLPNSAIWLAVLASNLGSFAPQFSIWDLTAPAELAVASVVAYRLIAARRHKGKLHKSTVNELGWDLFGLSSTPPVTNESVEGTRTYATLRVGEIERHFDQQTSASIEGQMRHTFNLDGTSTTIHNLPSLTYDTQTWMEAVGSGQSSVQLAQAGVSTDDLTSDAFIAVFERSLRAGEVDTIRAIVPSEKQARAYVSQLLTSWSWQLGQGSDLELMLRRYAAAISQGVTSESSYVGDRLGAIVRMAPAERPAVTVIGEPLGEHAVLAGAIRFGADGPLYQLFPVALVHALSALIAGRPLPKPPSGLPPASSEPGDLVDVSGMGSDLAAAANSNGHRAPLTIRTVGGLRLTQGGEDLTPSLGDRKVLAFLWLYLMARKLRNAHDSITRAALADELSPGLDSSTQRSRLRGRLSELRNQLPSAIGKRVEVAGERISLDLTGCDIDIQRLLDAGQAYGKANGVLTAEQLTAIEAAVSDADGVFLPNWDDLEQHVNGARGGASEVIADLRRRVEAARSSLLRSLGEGYLAHAKPEAAIGALERALEHTPDDESVARTLVAACLQSGRLARAEQLRKEFSLV